MPLPVARLRCTAVAGGCERFGISSAEAAETARKAFAFTFGDAVKVCGLNFGITAALAGEFAPNGKSVQPTCAVFDLRGASRIKAAGTDTRQGVDTLAESLDFLTVIHGLTRKEKSDLKNIKWLPIPIRLSDGLRAFTMSVSGQRGLTLKPPAATACSARIAPAKAIIAPLSVQYPWAGNRFARLRRAFSDGLCPAPDGWSNGSIVAQLFLFAPTPPATTSVRKPVSRRAFPLWRPIRR